MTAILNFLRRPWVSWTLVACCALGGVGLGGLFGAYNFVCRGEGQCPSASSLETYVPNQTSKLYAADGRFIGELGAERRTLISVKDVPKMVREAFVMNEDKRFYSHSGVDWFRIPGAVLRNLRARSFVEGFSTITMQLARNVFPERITRQKSPLRKLKEIYVARDIEKHYKKDQILELYLNQMSFGNGAFGIQTAAQRYFGKTVQELNVAEAAMLSGLLKGPSRYNPRRFADRAIQRRNTVIELMRREKVISDNDASLAKAFPLQLARRTESGEVAPYYVEWVRQQLDAHFGQQLYEQGYKVYTTLDVDMQAASERALEQQLRAIEAGRVGPYKHLTYEAYLAKNAQSGESAGANSPYLQGAFVALDPRSGAVRAMVGGRDFDDSQFNRAVQALRQPGSTFKPVMYATAIHAGFTPAQMVDDAPIAVEQLGGEDWTPQNYDLKFMGEMPMRKALYMSRNLAAIRTGMEVGPEAVISMARKFGIHTPIPPYPSIYIGSADVYPVEMIGAYSVFANLGLRTEPHAIIRVEDANGKKIWEPKVVREPVLSPEESWLMVSMMKDVVVRGTAAANVTGAGFHVPAGGKTGTTNDGSDVWFIGYTADLVAGVWMGFDKPQKIKANAQGGQLAAPAWTAFMTEVYRRKPNPPDWPMPDGIVTKQIDGMTGRLPNNSCMGNIVTEYFVMGTEPQTTCSDPAVMRPMLPADSIMRARKTADSLNPFTIPPIKR
ncbi:MAG: PBP1A family penicillin-binding protein [Gemmatimonas sp.]